jgi:hypothetical protein
MGRDLQPHESAIGQPAGMYLGLFGHILCDVFGYSAYQVGSSLGSRDYRDVDVRVILGDEEFAAMFGTAKFPLSACDDGKWKGICMAFSALGCRITGLPIDFQVQPQTWANEHNDGPRNCITISGCRREVSGNRLGTYVLKV